LFMFAPISFGISPPTRPRRRHRPMVGWGQESHRAQRGVSLTRQSQKGFEREDHLLLISFPVCSQLWSMRGRRDPHDDPAPAQSRPRGAVPEATVGALLHEPYWFWLRCDACGHCIAVALVPFVIRWGADVSSDMWRQHARCSSCGRRGATLQHPSWGEAAIGWEPFSVAGRRTIEGWADLNDPPKPIDSTRLVQKEYLLRRCGRGAVLTFGE
jgi:hypothetical protein